MNPKKTLFFVFHGIMHLIIVAAAKQFPISRRAMFSIQENMRLKGHVVDSFNSPSLTSCSHSCLRNSWCSSTNFKKPSKENDRGTCELNQHGFLDEDAEFQDEQGVTYSMFLKVWHGKKLCSHVFSYFFFHFSGFTFWCLLSHIMCNYHEKLMLHWNLAEMV